MMRFDRVIIFSLALVCIAFSPPAWAREATQALADKSDRVVVFFDDQGQEILRAHAVFGQVKGPKIREGDSKTPEGDYWIAPARPSTEWEWFMPINYPNEADVARAKAAGQAVDTLGGQIGLHSVGDGFLRNVRQSFNENWTLGCIAVSMRDMARIRPLVAAPIPLRIQP